MGLLGLPVPWPDPTPQNFIAELTQSILLLGLADLTCSLPNRNYG